MSDQVKLPPVEPASVIPAIQAEQPQTEGVMLAGVAKMIVPTIMQCGQGGYLVTIPGVGLKATSSLEECMEFISVSATAHFTVGRIRTFPKVVDNLKEAMQNAAQGLRRTDPVAMLMVSFGILVGLMYWTTGDNNGPRSLITGENLGSHQASYGPSIRRDSGGSGQAREPREKVLPEVYVRQVQTTPYDGRAQYTLQGWTLR